MSFPFHLYYAWTRLQGRQQPVLLRAGRSKSAAIRWRLTSHDARCSGSTRKGEGSMKRYSYRERDYAFGQRILTLRTSIGLTQAGLAELLHVSRRAVGEWELGSSYPKAQHLQQVMTLAVRASAFPPRSRG